MEAQILVACFHRLNTVAVYLTSCWFGVTLHIQCYRQVLPVTTITV